MESEEKDYVNDFEADVYDLAETQENFDILMERMEIMDDYNTYQRIINDFAEFLPPDLRTTIIAKGKDAFGPEFIQNLDSYVEDLEVSQENCDLLLHRIKQRDDYSAYTRLVFEFDEFLTPEKRKKIIARAKEIFIAESTKDWE
uniref:Uncharacterized protein n=1 Tax=Promethearchaeum syntrophicum TaxID=2594042 RepID=A0A5B9DG52_9ARCH|nr:hypothetical protein [Candidatus Prometheoarchaeum syntrophicum]QEE17763.1 hypothetical protein DSAG12_03601 [Candidatus Prometheoarchaeum syntrophicum]